MRTRREQFQAYHFVTRRIVSAMTSGRPDNLELPLRRTTMSVLGGLALAVLIFVGFWVVGLIFPAGNQLWKQEGSIVIDDESGAVYVYIDATLFPVTNLASAKLMFDSPDVPVHMVSPADLAGEPRGWEIGIRGGPESLPPPDALVSLPWQVCTAPEPDNPMRQTSHVLLDAPATGESLGDGGLVVADEADERFLVLADRKHEVSDDATLLALGIDPDAVTRVDSIFLDAVVMGPALEAPDIDDRGDSADALSDHDAEYGDLFTAGGRDYVLTVDGLAPIGATSKALLSDGEPVTPTSLTATEVDEVGTTTVEPEGFPQDVPRQVTAPDGAAVCTVFEDEEITVSWYPEAPAEIGSPASFAPRDGLDVVDTAEHVWVPGGGGALIRSQATPGAVDGTLYLITDLGVKYALAGDAATLLGYRDVTPLPVPATFVALIPTGPALDPERARTQVP
ncbi:type VII secretion protein EccB [Stackebrandtia albiflava]|uniref:Type VII secretion protein EccB n=1 Tax=Stackebrandtia albiflava TaxID=406432 RepID=A0A562VC17_9ACTN|nr:type VII secretion protein EccB [Stackebrandtia albiflava]TWJ15398.1 type VII secretion protein EccB [Stackebrandtia albiflava]